MKTECNEGESQPNDHSVKKKDSHKRRRALVLSFHGQWKARVGLTEGL